jgi:hypothetical protein
MVVINREQVTHIEMSGQCGAYIYFNGYALKLWVTNEADQEILLNFRSEVEFKLKQVPRVIKTRVVR